MSHGDDITFSIHNSDISYWVLDKKTHGAKSSARAPIAGCSGTSSSTGIIERLMK